jgi:hypothetical protein
MIRAAIFILIISLPFVLGAEGEGQQKFEESQAPSGEFDHQKWQDLKSDIDYPKKEKKGKKEEKQESSSGSTEPAYDRDWKFSDNPIWKIIFYSILAIGIGLVLYFVFIGGMGARSRKIKQIEEELEDSLEGDILKTELEILLDKALETGAYPLAVRIYYLMIIQSMTRQEWIVWKKEKTNNQYLYEMRDRKEFNGFSSLTRIFEYVWYGDQVIDQSAFSSIQPQFTTFLETIKVEES